MCTRCAQRSTQCAAQRTRVHMYTCTAQSACSQLYVSNKSSLLVGLLAFLWTPFSAWFLMLCCAVACSGASQTLLCVVAPHSHLLWWCCSISGARVTFPYGRTFSTLLSFLTGVDVASEGPATSEALCEDGSLDCYGFRDDQGDMDRLQCA